jgi:hypothetical protein
MNLGYFYTCVQKSPMGSHSLKISPDTKFWLYTSSDIHPSVPNLYVKNHLTGINLSDWPMVWDLFFKAFQLFKITVFGEVRTSPHRDQGGIGVCKVHVKLKISISSRVFLCIVPIRACPRLSDWPRGQGRGYIHGGFEKRIVTDRLFRRELKKLSDALIMVLDA